MDRRIPRFCAKTSAQIPYHHFQFQYISLFLLYQKYVLLNILKFSKGKYQPHKMVKSLCESAVVLILSPIPNLFNWVTKKDFQLMKTSVFYLKWCKKETIRTYIFTLQNHWAENVFLKYLFRFHFISAFQ